VTVRPPVLAGLPTWPTCSLSWRAARLTSTTTTRGGGLWILDRTYSAFEVDLAKFNRGRLQALSPVFWRDSDYTGGTFSYSPTRGGGLQKRVNVHTVANPSDEIRGQIHSSANRLVAGLKRSQRKYPPGYSPRARRRRRAADDSAKSGKNGTNMPPRPRSGQALGVAKR
jgi:hypothetical protein